MNRGLRTKFTEEIQHFLPAPHVEFVMCKAIAFTRKPILVPTRVSVGPEKVGAHIVVHAMHSPTQTVEVVHHLRANEAVRSRN
jgi:hypothetical protein